MITEWCMVPHMVVRMRAHTQTHTHTHTPHTQTPHTHTRYSLPHIPSHTHTLSPLSHPSHRMRGDGSNLIRDRKYHLHSYHSCFVGQEFVDWLVKKGEAQNRKEATEIGMQLVDAGVIKHGMSLMPQLTS